MRITIDRANAAEMNHFSTRLFGDFIVQTEMHIILTFINRLNT
jgi:hypothetical protein